MTAQNSTLSHDHLLEILEYDLHTGLFTNLVQRSSRALVGTVAGCLGTVGYTQIRINKVTYLAHRLAWFYQTGRWPVDMLDHLNRNKTDNRFCNLREVDNTTNQRNASMSKMNTSGFSGVHWCKTEKKWIASIRDGKKKVHAGNFTDMNDAIKARKKLMVKYGYHPNHGVNL